MSDAAPAKRTNRTSRKRRPSQRPAAPPQRPAATSQRSPAQRPSEGAPRPRPRGAARSRPGLPRGLLTKAFIALAGFGVLFVVSLWAWASSRGPGTGQRVSLLVPEGASASEVARALESRGLIASPRLFALYLWWSRGKLSPGSHLLRDDLSARELAQRLERLPGRPKVRVTFPEGWNHLQMAERLEQREVVEAEAFKAAVWSPAVLEPLGISGPSAEGYLFPATYEFFVDSAPEQVVRLLVEESKKRIGKLVAERPNAFDDLQQRLGFGVFEILTLASIVEKEAQDADERPLVASVFYNRLTDPTFKPARMLQSDPTAAYGCLIAPESAPSCADYQGRVTPAMVRDPANLYNTYKHPGLPPGPISNPGEPSIVAVLEPAKTDYLYFVTRGGGRHAFTRTFTEHRQVIESRATAKDAPKP